MFSQRTTTNYQEMPFAGDPRFQQLSSEEQSQISKILEKTNFVRAESMDLTNDPRFFTDNVIDKRLAAFGGLAMVSGLMVQNAIDQSFDMKKNMVLFLPHGAIHWDGIFQLIGFGLLCLVVFANMFAVYVGVAQPYHTYRLMTAGPTGFESAAAYYLHKDIISYRHAAVKLMLLSMPVFCFSSAFRMVVKFDTDITIQKNLDLPMVPIDIRIEEMICFLFYMINGILMLSVHRRHEYVFRAMYNVMFEVSASPASFLNQVRNLMTPRIMNGNRDPLDV